MGCAVAAETLALFDLDHTLIPFDSGMAWTRFLVGRGVLPAGAEAQYLAYCHEYVAGTLDIHAMHRASLQPLLRHPRPLVAQWQLEFEAEMASRVPRSMLALMRGHQQAGDLCAIVTATTRLIAEPFARLFGIEHLLATQAATVDGSPGSPFTGEIDGEPCYRHHKVTRVEQWLATRSAESVRSLGGFARSWFYSDSISDLPLLGAVSDPVAVRPDVRLRDHAMRAGWTVLDLR
jgi:HAD superfamily hydrolase (TIGR01490 family)